MRKLIIALILAFTFSTAFGASLKLTTNSSALVEKVGSKDRPGLLLKFELPSELLKIPSAAEGQNARIDLALLRFEVNPDTSKEGLGLLVRPMLAPWVSGLNLTALPDSAASPFHANTGKVGFKTGTAKAEVTLAVKTWQKGELPNLGFLIYSADESTASLQPKSLSSGGVAELEIFYTAPEKE
ncbi:MAG: hypothetical protein L0Z48_02220 [candidate division Zixibacteria bacterium]|nr:hypothetical protein [candidate division Zixibacteria bacterium]MCI0595339.1 hypothetical protein [candidate division Zixibacteria bacterium]